MSIVETYSVRVSGVARINDDVNVRLMSVARITAFGTVAELPPLQRRLVIPIKPIAADKQTRIALIRCCHRKAARAGMFDHCEFQA